MQKFAILPVTLLLYACTGMPEPDGDWIEIPLADHTWSGTEIPLKQGEYEITVEGGSALEYKIGLREGASIVYSLVADLADPSLLDIEFHGHTERAGDAPGTVMFYTIHNDGQEQGVLTAPFTGIHGWYLNNHSEDDVVVTVRIAGFYEELE